MDRDARNLIWRAAWRKPCCSPSQPEHVHILVNKGRVPTEVELLQQTQMTSHRQEEIHVRKVKLAEKMPVVSCLSHPHVQVVSLSSKIKMQRTARSSQAIVCGLFRTRPYFTWHFLCGRLCPKHPGVSPCLVTSQISLMSILKSFQL